MRTVLATTIILAGSVATLLAGAPRPADSPKSLGLRLEQIKEVRRLDVKPRAKDAMHVMFDEPGLTLKFGVSLPTGKQLIRLEQPTSVQAVDSEGQDLAKITKDVFGNRKYAELIREWDKPPHALEFKLAPLKRSAATFTVKTQFEAVTCRETAPMMIDVTAKPTVVPDLLPGEEIKVRADTGGGSLGLKFTPGSVRDVIEKVELKRGDQFVSNQGSMWNDDEVTYLFPAGEVGAVRLTVRRGLERVPVAIDLRDQKLP
jgi:hypothetical protein